MSTGSKDGRRRAGATSSCGARRMGASPTPRRPASTPARECYEYGGAPYLVDRGIVFFSNFEDQRLYRQRPGATPEPLTPPGCFYADCQLDRARGRLIVRARGPLRGGRAGQHHRRDRRGPTRALPLQAAGPHTPPPEPGRVLGSGADFYSDPDPQPRRLDAGVAGVEPSQHAVGRHRAVGRRRSWPTGGPARGSRWPAGADESIFQPEWSPDGTLYFVSDRTGWWNLYRQARRRASRRSIRWPAEFGKPQWTFERCDLRLHRRGAHRGHLRAGRPLEAGVHRDRARASSSRSISGLEPLESIRADARAVYFIGGSPTDRAGDRAA